MNFKKIFFWVIVLFLILVGVRYCNKSTENPSVNPVTTVTPTPIPIDPKSASENLKKSIKTNSSALAQAFKKIIFTRKESLLNAELGDHLNDADRKMILMWIRAKNFESSVDAMTADDIKKIEEEILTKAKTSPDRIAVLAMKTLEIIDEMDWSVDGSDGYRLERKSVADLVKGILAKNPNVSVDRDVLERQR